MSSCAMSSCLMSSCLMSSCLMSLLVVLTRYFSSHKVGILSNQSHLNPLSHQTNQGVDNSLH